MPDRLLWFWKINAPLMSSSPKFTLSLAELVDGNEPVGCLHAVVRRSARLSCFPSDGSLRGRAIRPTVDKPLAAEDASGGNILTKTGEGRFKKVKATCAPLHRGSGV